ncbi:MAG: hypothetical protein COT81_00545 [Candidatus Buchananbacteria bacterium CG10_big_fil_rev_8_21_14_0_10_42_9]|uniref:Uncharacterized protein n=1 Tax=Candidatus Buchananbacteria bacterium CG10_big_fil_rev_8_21_14_0_10_42_9 TaxID=1974526 RepID=A0A2H0W4D4_9BACT|nr:MAG: hypothetical protein COT81_00545 [Candidatus Buchananbacteria bacterium CG10_big_fil_rev_8_21_14_0_10_42_9]
MHEIIAEPIEVLVGFCNSANNKIKDKVVPLFFKWRNHRYKVDKINLIHKQKEGRGIIYYFNVSHKTNYFKLSFSTIDLKWRLEELYYS